MISGFLETRLLPDDHLQKDLSGHTVPKPKPAQRIKDAPTGSGQDPRILITTVLRSAHTRFSTSNISSTFREAGVAPCRWQPAPPVHMVQRKFLHPVQFRLWNDSGTSSWRWTYSHSFEMLSVAHLQLFVFSLANMEIRIQGWFYLITYLNISLGS